MVGDQADFVTRLKSTLPVRWFPDQTPVLDALLTGLSTAWAWLYSLLSSVRLQSRIATATGSFLDGASGDFFGDRLPRLANEADTSFRIRVQRALVRDHATRAALSAAVQDLTGFAPAIFEPSRVTDTGAYNLNTLGYGTAGAWGSLALPFQVFVSARRPAGAGIAFLAGYGTGGPLARGDLSQIAGQVTDTDIERAVLETLPTATTAWLRISN